MNTKVYRVSKNRHLNEYLSVTCQLKCNTKATWHGRCLLYMAARDNPVTC